MERLPVPEFYPVPHSGPWWVTISGLVLFIHSFQQKLSISSRCCDSPNTRDTDGRLHLHPYLSTEVAQQVTTLALKLDNLSLTSGTHAQTQMQCYTYVMPVVLTQDGSGRVQGWENLPEEFGMTHYKDVQESLLELSLRQKEGS